MGGRACIIVAVQFQVHCNPCRKTAQRGYPSQRLVRTYWYIASLETFTMIQLAAKSTEACFNIGGRRLLRLVEGAERNGARRSALFGEMPRRTRPLRPVWRSEAYTV